MNYKDIIGHKKTIEILKDAIKNENISHSYIFEGEEGLGKRKVAFIFAKTLLCKEQGEEPCDRCISCLKFDSGNHPDLVLIEPENGLIKRGDIDKLVKSVDTAPFESLRKVFIVDDSHLMNMEAKNTLLKTLEEPPKYINIILITSNPGNLLPTIVSRCQNIKFFQVEIKKIADLLVNLYGKSPEESVFIAEFSKGSVGKSIRIAKSDSFFQRRDTLISIIDKLLKGDSIKAFSSIGFFNENKEDMEELLDLIIYWLRDLIIYKEIGNNDLIVNKDKINILSGQTFLNIDKINDIIDKVNESKTNIKRNINFQLTIETMLLSMI